MLYGNFVENDIWAGKYYCPECGKQMDFYLARVYYRVKLFRGATIFSRFKKRVCICEKCGSCKVLDRAEYNEMHTEAVARARRGEFPARIIARDFSPRSIKLYRKLARMRARAFMCAHRLRSVFRRQCSLRYYCRASHAALRLYRREIHPPVTGCRHEKGHIRLFRQKQRKAGINRKKKNQGRPSKGSPF